MLPLDVGEGDDLSPGQVIGRYERSRQWYNHVHIELDTDTAFPFHTPRVSEASSRPLNRHPASGDSLLDPLSVLVAGPGTVDSAPPRGAMGRRVGRAAVPRGALSKGAPQRAHVTA